MSRIVFHIDVNSAFLSWSALERLEQNPDSIDLRTIPSAVAGDVASRRGVVTAASIPAKRLGVKSGEPVSAALRLCPNLVLVASNFSYYRRKSVAFLEILNRHSSAVEQFSIDEAFLDMSARFSDRRREEAAIRACAAAIQTEIRETLGFTVNVGISENKLLAKMASDFEKPDKIHTLWPEELSAKFYPLPIRSLFGVGGQSAEKLLRFGIHTIGEAADTPCEVLQRILGPSAGKSVYQSARGVNHSAVRRERPQAKSHSVERTTTTDIEKRNAATELPPLLSELAEELSSRLRKANVRAETLVIIAKTSSFQRHTRQQRLLVPSNEKEVLEASARELFSALLEGDAGLFAKREALRLVGIGAARLEDPQYQQLSLFSLPSAEEMCETKQRAAAEAAAEAEERAAARAEKRRKLGEMQAAISARYGDGALLRGGELLSAARKETQNAQSAARQERQQSTEL
ncbi:Y-family DNA polymerase [Stomatobaculum longum]|uniref:Y-family DNA polymerase n=1 Tax=Stomatobaculum longum TaxID=796942 RepID=UPI0028DC1B2C|nr:DNA polymerase IV [Stomatobaculum longum]